MNIMKKNTVRLDDYSWEEIKHLEENGYKTIVFGIGATEQHGPSLPLQADALQADKAANIIASELPNALQAPTIRVGYSKYHMHFSGTITLRESTLQAIIEDYIDSFVHHGFSNIVIFISHGGNVPSTEKVVKSKQEQYPNTKIVYYYDQDAMTAIGELAMELQLTPAQIGTHAGHMEASLVQYYAEDLVDKNKLIEGYIGEWSEELHQKMHEMGMHTLTKNGVLGDQRGSSKEMGKKYLNVLKPVMMNYIKKKLEE
ncbi:MAG: creatininase family protein [Promethearchaeota archaeon]|nr:MAG: creatininase family protein [Candidatus Lokiarchaeota archaeon]